MYLLFDIGGTNTRLAVSSDGLSLTKIEIIPTPQNFADGLNNIIEFARSHNQASEYKAIAGGIAGPLNKEKTMITNAPNLKDWNDKPFKTLLSDMLQAPVLLENDTVMIGIGEAAIGAGRGHNIVAYLTISTGIGGARIVSGNLDSNAFGFEPGHQIISSGTTCGCGADGHLESLASGTALFKKYRKPASEIDDPAVWEEAAAWLARGLNNTIVYWSPNVIVLGGSLMKKIQLARVQYHLASLTTIFPELPPLKLAALNDTGGLKGSLIRAHQKHPL